MTRPRIAIPIPTNTDIEYNHRTWPQYALAVELSGGEAVEVPLVLSDKDVAALIADCSGFVLPGSGADVDPALYGHDREPESAPADPARERLDTQILEHAYGTAKPVLAICFGTQMLNVWRGGTLVQHLTCVPVNHAAGKSVAVAHVAVVAPDSLLGELVATDEAPERDGLLRLPVNSSHHQAIGVPGDGLKISARSAEDGVIEGVEGGDAPGFLIGVQWHPERSYEQSAASRALFARLVSEAAAWVPRAEAVSVG